MKKLLLFTSAFMLFAFSGWAQKIVAGTVQDDGGLPLPGATVIEKGTSNGVSTDFDGNFSIEVAEDAVLEISFIGYGTVEVSASADDFNITLTPGNELEEVIVTTGYTTLRNKSFTGSAKIVTAENIATKNVTNITQALAGEAAGIQVVNSTGQPGSASTIQIRGIGSVNGNTSPLIVLDGVAFNGSINSINPQDIETTTVLKDASATAIYGSRGANGVIVITTRKGSAERSNVSVQLRTGKNMQYIPMYPTLDNPEDFISVMWDGQYQRAIVNGSADPVADANANLFGPLGISPAYNMWNVADGGELIDPTTKTVRPGVTRRYTPERWADYAFQDASRQEINVNMSGGSGTTTYYSSLGFVDDIGYSVNSDFSRYSARLNVSSKPKDWLSTNTRLGYSYQETNNNGQSNSSSSVFWLSQNIPSIYPLFFRDADGNRVEDPIYGGYKYDYSDEPGYSRGFSPLTNSIADANLGINETIAHNFNGNFEINIDLAEGLVLQNRFGLQYVMNNYDNVQEPFYSSTKGQGGSIQKVKNQYLNYQLFNGLTYTKAIGDDQNINVLVAHEATRWERNRLSAFKYKLVDPFGRELDNAVISNPPSSYTEDFTLESYIANVAYSIKDKYFIDITARRDGSSRFVNNKWGDFGSVGLSWSIGDEDFFQSQNIFSSMKLRTSYGQLGEQRVGYYTGYNLFNVSNLNDNISLAFASKGNPDLTWETSEQIGVGLDFSVGSIASVSLDWYSKENDNLIVSRNVGPSVGYRSLTVNDGGLKNSGIEFDVNLHVIDKEDLKFDIRLIGSKNKNEYTRLPIDPATNEEKLINNNGYFSQAKGKSLREFYMREWAGVNPATGAAQWNVSYVDADGNGEFDSGEEILSLYDYRIENPTDVISEGITETYSEATQKFVGKSAIPDLAGSFSLNAEYKDFDLTALFTYSLGGYGYDFQYAALMDNPTQNADSGFHPDINNRWQNPGDVTDVPRVDLNTQTNQNSTSTRFLTKLDYLNLASLRFGYNIPSEEFENTGITSARIFLTGDNLFLASAREGYNPTTSLTGTSSRYTYSPLTTITLGLNINF